MCDLCHVCSASLDFSSLPFHAVLQLFQLLFTLFLTVLVPAVICFQRTHGGNQIKKSEARRIIPASSGCSSHQKARAMFQLEEVRRRAQHSCTDPPRISGMQCWRLHPAVSEGTAPLHLSCPMDSPDSVALWVPIFPFDAFSEAKFNIECKFPFGKCPLCL